MMEEAADDANGDSTFEFVAVKDTAMHSDTAEAKPDDSAAGSMERTQQMTPSSPPVVTTVPTSFQPAMPPQTLTQSQAPLRPSPFQHTQVTSAYSPGGMHPPQGVTAAAAVAAPAPGAYASQFPPPLQPAYQPPQMGAQHQSQPPPQHGSGDQSFSVSLPADYDQNLPQSSSGTVGVWGWFKGNDFLNKVAEKAKNSVDSMITTLDPGMKEFIYSGGDIDILVASHDEIRIIGPVREAFQKIFGRATVTGVTMPPSNMAPQPVGFAAGLQAAEDRITSLQQTGRVSAAQPILAVESFIVELTSDSWFDMHCLVLKDDPSGLLLHTFGQPTPVPAEFIAEMQDRTPADYPLRWCGLAVTVGEVASPRLVVPQSEWRAILGGIPDSQLVSSAACALASMYRRALRR
ncbi:protein PRRC1-like isoform X2 [Dermacentor andersoni]|uniref:protein PRRC1-like isoform X2 n=1 Tax=Dermacentor andersoni TaxID=34620 RepID=UPI00215582C4|nr:protein PRRC1-like isoform X2 [Dermacentor andersoni]